MSSDNNGYPTTLLGWVGYIIGCVLMVFIGFIGAIIASCFRQ